MSPTAVLNHQLSMNKITQTIWRQTYLSLFIILFIILIKFQLSLSIVLNILSIKACSILLLIKHLKMHNEVNQLQQILQCIICSLKFNAKERKPMFICKRQHFICKLCLDEIMIRQQQKRKCSLCRTNITLENIIQFRALIEMVSAASKIRRNGSKIKRELAEAQLNEKRLFQQICELKSSCKCLKEQLVKKEQKYNNDINQYRQQSTKLSKKIQKLVEINSKKQQLIEIYHEKIEEVTSQNQQLKKNYLQILPKIEAFQLYNSNQIIKPQISKKLEQKSKIKHQQKQQQISEFELQLNKKQDRKNKIIKLPVKRQKQQQKNSTSIDLSKKFLKTIETHYFTKVVKLNLSDNKLTQIDLTNSTHLQHLNISNNELAVIDLSNNKRLIDIQISKNKLCFVLINYKSYLQLRLANQKVEQSSVMIKCFTKEKKQCEQFIEKQTNIYKIIGDKWSNSQNVYNCLYSFQIDNQY